MLTILEKNLTTKKKKNLNILNKILSPLKKKKLTFPKFWSVED